MTTKVLILGGGFSKNERCKQAQKYSYLCKLFNDQGIIVVAAVGGLIKKIHVWNIDIKNDNEDLICVSRLTLAVINQKKILESKI